jgi:UDP-glucose 4-epimerase
MATVLVTGADGFLGTHVCRRFERDGWTVERVSRRGAPGPGRHVVDLPDPDFDDVLSATRPDVLIHAAGPASVPASVADPAADFRGSAAATSAILDSLRRRAPRCVFAFPSSGAVYGNATQGPVNESAPIAPLSPYGWHKRISELLCEEYAAIYGVRSVVFRIFSAYGEGQRKQVVYDLFRKISDPAHASIDVIGTGAEARDFVHAADIAEAMHCAIRAGLAGPVNVGTGSATAVADLVQMMRAAAGSAKPVRFTGAARRGDPDVMNADTGRLVAIGFSPQVSLAQGLRRYLDWLKETAQ